MDLNSISQHVAVMPDFQLMQEVNNPNGMVPQYMALAELNKRSKLRQGQGGQQQPQGTVAQDVMRSLAAGGMGGGPQQQQQPQPAPPQHPMMGWGQPPQGIAQGPSNGQQQAPQQQMPPQGPPPQQGIAQKPQGMRMGGAIGLRDGNKVPDAPSAGVNQLVDAGLVAPNVQLDHSAYQVAPDQYQHVSPEQEVAHARSLYGPGEDYSPVMREIEYNRAHQQYMTPQDQAQMAGLMMMASKDPNAVSGMANSYLGAFANRKAYDDDTFKNRDGLSKEQYALLKNRESRNDEITGTGIGMADKQTALNQGDAHWLTELKNNNAQRALSVDDSNRTETRNFAKDTMAGVGMVANPLFTTAAQQIFAGDPAKNDLMSRLKVAGNAQMQRQIDMKTRSEMAVESAKQNALMSLYKVQQGVGSSGDTDAALQEAAKVKAAYDFSLGRSMDKIPSGRQANPIAVRQAQMYQQEYTAFAKNGGKSAAQNYIETVGNKAAAAASAKNEANVGAAAGAMDLQGPQILKTADQVKYRTGSQMLDEGLINAQVQSSNPAVSGPAKVLQGQMETFANEYAIMQGRGQSDMTSKATARKLFSAALNHGTMDQLIQFVKFEGGTKVAGYHQQLERIANGYTPDPKLGGPATPGNMGSAMHQAQKQAGMSADDIVKHYNLPKY